MRHSKTCNEHVAGHQQGPYARVPTQNSSGSAPPGSGGRSENLTSQGLDGIIPFSLASRLEEGAWPVINLMMSSYESSKASRAHLVKQLLRAYHPDKSDARLAYVNTRAILEFKEWFEA